MKKANFNLYIWLNDGLQYLFVCTYLNSNLMNTKLLLLSWEGSWFCTSAKFSEWPCQTMLCFCFGQERKVFSSSYQKENTFLLWRLIFSLTRIYFLWLTFPMFTKYRKVKKMVFRNLFSWKQTRHKYIWLEKNIKSLFLVFFNNFNILIKK